MIFSKVLNLKKYEKVFHLLCYYIVFSRVKILVHYHLHQQVKVRLKSFVKILKQAQHQILFQQANIPIIIINHNRKKTIFGDDNHVLCFFCSLLLIYFTVAIFSKFNVYIVLIRKTREKQFLDFLFF